VSALSLISRLIAKFLICKRQIKKCKKNISFYILFLKNTFLIKKSSNVGNNCSLISTSYYSLNLSMQVRSCNHYLTSLNPVLPICLQLLINFKCTHTKLLYVILHERSCMHFNVNIKLLNLKRLERMMKG
jgi:hypothetical protein